MKRSCEQTIIDGECEFSKEADKLNAKVRKLESENKKLLNSACELKNKNSELEAENAALKTENSRIIANYEEYRQLHSEQLKIALELKKRLECPPVVWDESGVATINSVHVGYAPWRRKSVGCPRELKFMGEPNHCLRKFFKTHSEAMKFVEEKSREFWNKIHGVE